MLKKIFKDILTDGSTGKFSLIYVGAFMGLMLYFILSFLDGVKTLTFEYEQFMHGLIEWVLAFGGVHGAVKLGKEYIDSKATNQAEH